MFKVGGLKNDCLWKWGFGDGGFYFSLITFCTIALFLLHASLTFKI